jgi:hypothetical protein
MVEKPVKLTSCPMVVMKAQVIHAHLRNTDVQHSTALPNKNEYERLSPSPAFRPHVIIQNTLQQTKQLAKSTIHYSMQHHLKHCFQMLRHKQFNYIIATNTYLSCEKSKSKAYLC